MSALLRGVREVAAHAQAEVAALAEAHEPPPKSRRLPPKERDATLQPLTAAAAPGRYPLDPLLSLGEDMEVGGGPHVV